MTIQCDEMWSVVGNKDNKQWIWLVLDIETREIVGCTLGIVAVTAHKDSGMLCLPCTDSVPSPTLISGLRVRRGVPQHAASKG